MLEEIYGENFIGTLSIVATIIAWILGVLFIIEGRQRKEREGVSVGIQIIIFGSIPMLNGFALAILLFFGAVALLMVLGSIVINSIVDKIVGE